MNLVTTLLKYCVYGVLALLFVSCSTAKKVAAPVVDTAIEGGAVFVDTLFGKEEIVEEEEAKPPIPIVIVTEGIHSPFNAIKEDGSLYGLDIDIGVALCLELNFACEWYIYTSDKIVSDLNARKIDLVISAIPVIPSNQQEMHLSEVYFPFSLGLLTRREAIETNPTETDVGPSYFYGRNLGVVKNSAAAHYARNNLKEAQLTFFANFDQALTALHANEVDALLHDSLILQTASKTQQALLYMDIPLVVNEPAVSSGYAIGVRKSTTNTQLIALINEAIAKLKRKGIYQEIVSKYTLE